jgi:hypothetical protein
VAAVEQHGKAVADLAVVEITLVELEQMLPMEEREEMLAQGEVLVQAHHREQRHLEALEDAAAVAVAADMVVVAVAVLHHLLLVQGMEAVAVAVILLQAQQKLLEQMELVQEMVCSGYHMYHLLLICLKMRG